MERQGLGMSVSWIAGSGLTYFRTFPNGFGYHVAGVGWGQGASGFWNVGGALTKELARHSSGSLYGLLASGAGISLFSGMGGLSGGTSPQINVAPGAGFTWGNFFFEGGMSFFYNDQGFGYTPAFGGGLLWWF
ncbi:MAG: hypothetical protein VKP62_15400 [Candidatus Sericytochromatia bacterium]|nr:hypothetical protein [Candidatus Sericytochromatia bacterium]